MNQQTLAAKARWSKPDPVMPIPRQKDLNKEAAQQAGAKFYLGSKCIHGHDGMRYARTGNCKTCVKIHNNNRNY